MTPLKTQAIQTALRGDWNSAVTINQLILQEDPNDIDTLNRLGFAHSSLGDVKKARQAYQKVLALDSQNPIALKNLKRLTTSDGSKITLSAPMNNIFIEEPGKTKVIELVNVADQKVTGVLRCGEYLNLGVKRMKIFALDGQKQYVGMLPDDISKRLIRFINGGNQYQAFVKTINNKKVTVFVKETKRVTKFKNQPSFATSEKSKLAIETGGKSHKKETRASKNHSSEEDESL